MSTGGREIVISKEFDAPPKLVFDAWTCPKKTENRSRLTHRLLFPSKKGRDKAVGFGAIEEGKQAL